MNDKIDDQRSIGLLQSESAENVGRLTAGSFLAEGSGQSPQLNKKISRQNKLLGCQHYAHNSRL